MLPARDTAMANFKPRAGREILFASCFGSVVPKLGRREYVRMRIASVVVVKILLLSFTSSALAQSLAPPHNPYIPPTITSTAQIVIPIETPNGPDVLVPLALTTSKQDRSLGLPESQISARTPLPAWTFVPFLDASKQVVFSAMAVQFWMDDRR